MIFGFIEDAVKATVEITEDVLDISLAAITFGEYGELNREKVKRLIESGITIHELSSASGIAIEVLREWLNESN